MSHENYKTTDLGLSATLTVVGFPVLDIDKTNPRRVVFLFEASDELDDSVKKYWSGELKVSANSLLDGIKYLKALIYS